MNSIVDPIQQPPKSGLNRRSFLQTLGVAAGAAAAPAILTGGARSAKADVASDIAILNFALNFEYIEAEYYTRGAQGLSITDFGIPTTGGGNPGTVTVKPNSQVAFTDQNLANYALEIAEDERLHVFYVRSVITSLGGTPIAMPSIDYTNGFNNLAVAAQLAPSFDPFANQENFLIGGFTFSDVTVTALRGAASLLTLPAVKSGAAGILGTEGYHDAILRYSLFRLGTYTQNAATLISNLRDSLDGVADLDQPVANVDGTPNIVPADPLTSIAFGRSQRQVLNIVYGAVNAGSGLFFPNGVNVSA